MQSRRGFRMVALLLWWVTQMARLTRTTAPSNMYSGYKPLLILHNLVWLLYCNEPRIFFLTVQNKHWDSIDNPISPYDRIRNPRGFPFRIFNLPIGFIVNAHHYWSTVIDLVWFHSKVIIILSGNFSFHSAESLWFILRKKIKYESVPQ